MNFNFISGNTKLSDKNILDQVEENRKELNVLNRKVERNRLELDSGVNIYFNCLILN
jgi:hypothetical protein